MRKLILMFFAAAVAALFVLAQIRPLLPESMAPSFPQLTSADMELARQQQPELELAISLPSGFYSQDITVELSADDANAAITYTTDGSAPTPQSSPYTGPLHFAAEAETRCLVLRALATGPNGAESAVQTSSYLLGTGVDSRFNTLVFSLSTDEDNLYGYENGIFVDGKIRDDFMKEHVAQGNSPVAEWHYPSSLNLHGPASERPVSVQVFTQNGACVLSQDAGLRVSGGGSRQYPQKSLRLIARRDYTPDSGRFEYPFFPGHTDALLGSPITSYDSLVLRAGGNDRYEAVMRNEAGYRLAADAGITTVSPTRAAAVFLNGEYYGFAWLQESVNQQALEDIYAAPASRFDFEDLAQANVGLDQIVVRQSEPVLDLADDAVFAEYQKLVDMDDLLFHYAFQSYIGNYDWPWNNIKLWRWLDDPEATAHPALDGRWRHVLYDLDCGFGFEGVSGQNDTLRYLVGSRLEKENGGGGRSQLFAALLQRPEVAAQFANNLCDMAESHLTTRAVEQTVAALAEESGQELAHALENGVEPGWVSTSALEESRQNMVDFIRQRPDYIYKTLAELFGYTDFYTVQVEGGAARVNSRTDGAGRYFVENTVPLTPLPGEGERFSHWELNGRSVTDEKLLVGAADAVDGVVRVRCVMEPVAEGLVIQSVQVDEGMNRCVVENVSGQPLSLEGWQLSDDPNQPDKWTFPDIQLAPGGRLELVGSRQQHVDVLLKMPLSFNISHGETLVLTAPDGHMADYMYAE